MSINDTTANESTDFDRRDARALTECMAVLPQGGDVYDVVGEHGATYTVDAREGRCTCPDAQYNLAAGEACKHERRVAYATGARPVPAWADRDAVDGLLGKHTQGTPRVAATDGGIIEAGDDAELLDDTDTDTDAADEGRPAACECGEFHADTSLPCWPCSRDGFNTPAPSEGEQ